MHIPNRCVHILEIMEIIMTLFRSALAALALGLAALPAAAGGLAPDLPRLDFPTETGATRGCPDPAGATVVCPGSRD
jgi:hypothetical protein